MSLWTGIKNLFETLGPNKSSDRDDETRVDGASNRQSTLSRFLLRLARISLFKHSEASKADSRLGKDSIHKAPNKDHHGETRPQPSQRPTDSVTGHGGSLLSNQRPHTPSTISTISYESIQNIVPRGFQDGIASASPSTAPSSLANKALDNDDDDDDEPDAAETQKLLDELESATTTRQRRRHIIHKRLSVGVALGWILQRPEDLWDTNEEQEARFAHMVADDTVKENEWQDKHGLYGLREDLPKKEYKRLRKRAKEAGWYVALQETVFGEEWCAEGGMFGEKGSGGPPPEEVGPMGETM